MVSEQVTRELRTALDTLRNERARLDQQIGAMENLLAQFGAPARRGPGRPPKNAYAGALAAPVKRGPGRPPKNASLATAAPVKRGPGRPKGSKNKTAVAEAAGKDARRGPKWSPEAREAARARMKAYWAARRKKAK